MILVSSSTGRLVKGDVLDVNKKRLERMLQDYDEQLYITWNVKKRKGLGVWEIRRRPLTKSVVQILPLDDQSTLVRIEYLEHNHIHHVMDAPVLHYKLLEQLQSMDLSKYNPRYFADMADKNLDSHKAKEQAKARKEMLYHAKQNRKAVQTLRERILSGMDPSEIARYWG